MASRPADGSRSARLATIEISETDMKQLSSAVLVGRLVLRGVSRITAERFIAIQRGEAAPGRARFHTTSRR
jgi:hypothetical protein